MRSLFAQLRRFLAELRRRNVYRVAVAYGVVAFVTLQVAELVFPATTLEGLYDEMVLVIFVGFPIALVVAWALELTPEGIQQTELANEDEMPGQSAVSSTYGWIGAAGLGLLLAGGWWVLADEGAGAVFSTNGTADTVQTITDRSIAVLPFENLSGRDLSNSVAPGLHEDLLTRLANASDLQVTSRTSVRQYRDTTVPMPAIAESLGVRWVLEGSVDRIGDQIDVSAQLIDPREDVHLWADSYQRELTAENVFAVQGEIAQEIADALQAELSPGEQRRMVGAPTEDLEAYRLYVRGRRQLAQRTWGSLDHTRKAIQYFRRALEQDSTFALAWAGLADAAGFYPVTPDSVPDPGVSQEYAARRALELDPDLAEAHASLGFYHFVEMNAPAARWELRRAIDLKPSYWAAHHWLGQLYLHIGRAQQALDHLKLAVELNPNHALARHWLYDAYNATGQYQRSLQEARRQRRMGLEQGLAVMGEVRALYSLGRFEDARRIAEQQIQDRGPTTNVGAWLRAYLVAITAAQGDTTQATRYLQVLKNANVPPLMLAWAYVGLGQTEEALSIYERLDPKAWGNIAAMYGLYKLGGRYKMGAHIPIIRDDPRYRTVRRDAHRAWGLNPDGGFPEEDRTTTPS